MEKPNFKKFVPYLIAIVAFVLISLIYFYPLMQGKALKQGDTERFKGMSKEITDFKKTTGETTLWTNSMFSGMPAYFVSVPFEGNLFKKVHKVMQLGLPHPAGIVFLYFIGFFILLLVLRVRPYLALIGAIAFALSSYFFIIIEAGHNTKAMAIAYMAPVLAGIILTYRGKYIAGALLTAFFLALEIAANHFQITYYLFLIVLVFGIYELVASVRSNQIKQFIKATAFLVIAALLAVGTHATSMLISTDHTQYTTRGKSELTFDEAKKTSGLDRDYVTQWSYGVSETMTLLIPDFMGGSSGGELSENSNVYQALIDKGQTKAQAKQFVNQNFPIYWGDQPFTSGPVYVGAIVFFLFIFGLFVVGGRMKWWLLTVTILSIMLSWGQNMMWFTNLFLDYFPGYNKFRAVTMTLVIAELAMPLLGILALAKIFDKKSDRKQLLNGLKYTSIILGGLLIILLILPTTFFSFSAATDAQMFASSPDWLLNAFVDDRVRIFKIDAIRSLFFIIMAAGLIWLYLKQKIKIALAMAGLGLLIFIDMVAVDQRYLNEDNFLEKTDDRRTARGGYDPDNPFQPSFADQHIMKDPDIDFRVLNLTVGTFQDASTSFFHNSIGGYHGAKLKRYQELIDFQIGPEVSQLQNILRSEADPQMLTMIMSEMTVLNMLNTKYLIRMSADRGPVPVLNPYAMGAVWFVNNYSIVANADEEIIALGDIDPSKEIVVDQRFGEYVSGKTFTPDSTASIELADYKPNHLTYQSKASTEQLAVFSEVYYPNGWTAYIDGVEADHFRANWILRSMVVPAGDHTIEFIFAPKLYSTGETISYICSILLLLLVLVYGVVEIRKVI